MVFRLTGLATLVLPLASVALGATQIPEEVTKVRDPFKKPVSRISHEKPRSPLELYPVEKFKLVGIVTGPRKLRAMLNGPDGKSYFVAEGTPIGVRKGVIRKISHDAVHVRERVLNVLGQEENVDSELKLPAEGKDLGTINAPMPEDRGSGGGQRYSPRGGDNQSDGNQGDGNQGDGNQGGGNQGGGNGGGNFGGGQGTNSGGGNNGGGSPSGNGGGNRQGGSG